MFCSDSREFLDCDHFIAKVIGRGRINICKDGEKFCTKETYQSLIIYGGFEPGDYHISAEDYTVLFVHKDGKCITKQELGKGESIGLKIHREWCEVYKI